MIPARFLVSVVTALAFFVPEHAAAALPEAPGPVADAWASVKAPYRLTLRERNWDGNPHAAPTGRAMLESRGPKDEVRQVWDLSNVTAVVASADGSTAALLTRDFEVFVSRLPETPKRVEGGPYLSPALSKDGTLLVAQRIGDGGHILERLLNTQGIALIDLRTGRDRLIVEGSDLYSPSFASDERVFFGSGGPERIASLYLLDIKSQGVARLTNRTKTARQTFPSQMPRINGQTVSYEADGQPVAVPLPNSDDFVPLHRFDDPQALEGEGGGQGGETEFGAVRLRTPTTQTNAKPQIYMYVDLDSRSGFIEDWSCAKNTYDQHNGTDFNQAYGLDVVAPASGTVIFRYDGCADNNSQSCAWGMGNHVAIQHADSTVSLLCHGKKWTVVDFGSYPCGAVVMKSASSGNSFAYHIHHETWSDSKRKYKSGRFDPFAGPCDAKDPTKWAKQNPYGSLPGTTCTN